MSTWQWIETGASVVCIVAGVTLIVIALKGDNKK